MHYADDERRELAPFVPAEARSVLDVGTYAGGFGATLRRILGPSAILHAIELDPANAELARRSGWFESVVEGRFPDDLGSGKLFDLITFLDVLEHMVDPWSALRDARRHLSPGGHVLASIPNVRHWPTFLKLLRGEWEYRDAGVLDRTHLRFFTMKSIRRMFWDCGFNILRCSGINSLVDATNGRTKFRLIRPLVPDMDFMQFVVLASAQTADQNA